MFDASYIIDQNTNCWIWTGQVGYDGYGELYAYNNLKPAHRFSYEIHKGEIPEKLLVCHTCDNPKCVNPDHLYAGTHQENMNDRKNRGNYISGSNHHMKKNHVRSKISRSLKGKKRPDLRGDKKPMSKEENRQKIRKKGNSIRKKVVVSNKTYKSLSDAARDIGVAVSTITRRVKDKVPGYKYFNQTN